MNKYQSIIAQLQEELLVLNGSQLAAFFTCMAIALFPLYERFNKMFKWGDASLLNECINKVKLQLIRNDFSLHAAILDDLLSLVPYDDDVSSIEYLYAEDAVICIDTAVRFIIYNKFSVIHLEYALKPMVSFISMENSDFIDRGTGDEADKWFNELVNDIRIKNAISFLFDIISQIKNMPSATEKLFQYAENYGYVLCPPANTDNAQK